MQSRRRSADVLLLYRKPTPAACAGLFSCLRSCRRGALRDAELGADDARQRLASARAEGHALAVELRASRERHRDEIRNLTEAHDARVKEAADRLLDVDDGICGACSVAPPPGEGGGGVEGGGGGLGLRGAKRGGGAVAAAAAAAPAATAAAAAAALTCSPVAAAIAKLAAQWRAFAWQETDANNTAAAGSGSGSGHRSKSSRRNNNSGTKRGDGGGGIGQGGGQRISISERQLLATTAFLQQTATRLDAECSRAGRRARAAEWELSGARRAQLDAAAALEEAREEVCRLSARTAATESALAAAAASAATHKHHPGAHAGHHVAVSSYPGPSSSNQAPGGGEWASNGHFGDGGGGGFEAWTGTGRGSYYTVAAVSLLEKRFAAAVEDLVALGAAAAAARAGEAAADARAEEAEARATNARADADVLAAELERHKAAAADEAAARAAEWRREIRAELGRWWQDDLVSQLTRGSAPVVFSFASGVGRGGPQETAGRGGSFLRR